MWIATLNNILEQNQKLQQTQHDSAFLSFDLLFTRHALSGENIHTNKQNRQ